MRLAIVPEGPLSFDGEKYWYSKGEWKYIDELASSFSEITVCAYAFHKGEPEFVLAAQAAFRQPNIRVVELPMCRSSRAGLLAKLVQLVRVTITIARHLRSWDILYLFMPGYPSSIAYLLNLVVHRPYFVYLADDWVQASPALFRWRGRRLLYGLFFRLNSLLQRRVVKDSLMIVTAGKDLYEKYRDLDKPIYETVPRMTLRAEDIVRRDDTCLREPIRLVYVGDLIGYKGVEYLIRAVALLGERSTHRYVLSIVGAGPLSEELRARAASEVPDGRIRFIGYVSDQQDLLQIYRESDVFVIPSLTEGFPRVLYEAMSQSLPPVATAVGGVPHVMKDGMNALLVPPRSAPDLAAAIDRIASDGVLRRRIIGGAQDTIRRVLETTDERQVEALLKRHWPPYREWAGRRA